MVIEFLPKLDEAVNEYRLSWIEKRPLLAGEDIVCILFFYESKMYISVVVIDSENKVIEKLNTMLFSEFVLNLIEVFKNS